VVPSPLVPGVYHALMDLNFRRLGPVFYRPACESCDECRAIRIPVREFRPSRAQRRCLRRNADLTVEVGPASPDEEKASLYRRYLEERHDGQMEGSPEELRFLGLSPIETVELRYRLGDRLLAVGLADREPEALSAVYCYFDPRASGRSLGVFNVLRMVEECRLHGVPYLYLGLFVRGSAKMSYKAGFRPCEILSPDGSWRRA
jgi:leucyl-tRNA---protein transferase